MLKKTALFTGLFIAIFIYFVYGSGWYEPAELIITGSADVDSSLTVQWDSGAGFNAYEGRIFSFLPHHGSVSRPLSVSISGGTERNRRSKGSRVILYELRADDHGVYIPPSALTDVWHVRGRGWVFDEAGSAINLDLTATQNLLFSFKTSGQSGIARVSINGTETSHDLYRRNWEVLSAELAFWLVDEDGHFTVSCKLPRYAIDTLVVKGTQNVSFSSVILSEKSGAADLEYELRGDNTLTIDTPNRGLKRYYHPVHLVLQCLFALLSASILFAAGRFLSGKGGLTQVFSRHRNELLLFAGGCAAYGLWLLAFWPGIMSVDSLNIWRAAILPEVMINNHPYINELWYFFLSLIWNNIAVVPIMQIILLSMLIACTLGYMIRQGVKRLFIIPVYLFFLVSVPIGLYNITLWKDVPFALLVILWALVPTYLYYKKRADQRFHVSIFSGILLGLSFVCLITFRHNGLVYLFVIPACMFVLGLIRVPKPVLVLGCLAIPIIAYLIVFPPARLKSASYFHDLSRTYIQQINKESLADRLFDSVIKYPRLLDIKKNQENSDFWHYYLRDRYAYRFLKDVGWSDVYPYVDPQQRPFLELRKLALKIYPMSLEYPWLYFSWYPFVLLYLFPLSLLLCRWFPLSAVFSTVILVQVAALLVFVGTTNWRYYYFMLLGGYFLLPVVLLDFRFLRNKGDIG